MQLTVARIGRAHGLRGEVALDLRTDNPGVRLAVGQVLGTDPAAAGPLDRRRHPRPARTLVRVVRRGHRPQRGRGAAGRRARRRRRGRRGGRRLVPARARGPARPSTSTGACWGRSPASSTCRRTTCSCWSRSGRRARTLVPFVRAIVPVVDVPGGRVVLDPPGGLLASDAENLVVSGDGGGAGRTSPTRAAASRRGLTCASTSSRSSPRTSRRSTSPWSARRARAGLLDVRVHDLRDWTTDRHRTVDDTPFGGGAGMVMRPDVWGAALDDVLEPGARTCSCRRPSGDRFTQRTAEALAGEQHLAIACGRYEGIDARVMEHYRPRDDVRVQRGVARRLRAQRRRGGRARGGRGRRRGCCRASSGTRTRWSRSRTARPGCSSTPCTRSRRAGRVSRCPRS